MSCDVNVNLLRANALVLQQRVSTLKTSLDAIEVRTSAWILNNTDAYLPSISTVKAQIEAYEALVIQLITLSDSMKAIKACDLEIPDHLVIPQSGIIIPSDGSFSF
jgi:hypothetical protein